MEEKSGPIGLSTEASRTDVTEVFVGNDQLVSRSHSETKIKESKTETIKSEQSTLPNAIDTNANGTNSLSIKRNSSLFETN